MGLYLLLIFSLVSSTPGIYGNDNEQQVTPDQEVKELENLRTINQRPSDTPPIASEIQQDEASVPPTTSRKIDDNIDPQPNSRNAIFRHRGITQAKKNKFWDDKTQQGFRVNIGIEYSPADLATYVFNTGDEEGVAVAIEELVREGMMGRTDAINYLQDVKQILNDMRKKVAKQLFLNSLQEMKREDITKVTTAHPAVIASTSEPKDLIVKTTVRSHLEEEPTYSFTLDVIYKLTKDMFTQRILRDGPTAEETLSGLVAFLESEVGNKRISPPMKEKVLEIVSTALVDSLREYQGIVSGNQQPEDHHVEDVPMYRKLGIKENMLSTNNNKPKSSEYV